MTNERRILRTERADESGDVSREREGVVAPGRLVTGPVTAQVDRDGTVAGVGQGDQLVPPGPPELGEPVQ